MHLKQLHLQIIYLFRGTLVFFAHLLRGVGAFSCLMKHVLVFCVQITLSDPMGVSAGWSWTPQIWYWKHPVVVLRENRELSWPLWRALHLCWRSSAFKNNPEQSTSEPLFGLMVVSLHWGYCRWRGTCKIKTLNLWCCCIRFVRAEVRICSACLEGYTV